MGSQESLGPSDDEGNAAFQRDGPGRISIKKGVCVCVCVCGVFMHVITVEPRYNYQAVYTARLSVSVA